MKETEKNDGLLRRILSGVNRLLHRSAVDKARSAHERHKTPTIDPSISPEEATAEPEHSDQDARG